MNSQGYGSKQIIISIGREFGSSGHYIAETIAKYYGIPLYDYNLLKEIADDKKLDVKTLQQYDELPRSTFLSRTVRGHNNSPEYNLAMMQFDYLRKKAAEGMSYVVVGRCSEEVLQDYDCLVTIFVVADMEDKINHVSEVYKLSREKAKMTIISQDNKRMNYHNYYCRGNWGEAKNYDLCINSSKLGVDRSITRLKEYINARISMM